MLGVQQGCKNISAKIRILDVHKSKKNERKTDRTSKKQAFNGISLFSLDCYVTKHLLSHSIARFSYDFSIKNDRSIKTAY